MGNSDDLEPNFWQQKPLSAMSDAEWEALCDGCGKCCLHKLQDDDTDEIFYTRVACQLLDRRSGRCSDYANRKQRVPECLDLRQMPVEQLTWMPETCAYRRLNEGRGLPDWHYLRSGRPGLVHKATCSVRGRTISELDADLENLETQVIHWVHR